MKCPSAVDGIARKRFRVMAVDLDGAPAEGPPFFGQRLQCGDGGYRSVDLGIVCIDDDDEAVEAVMRREHCGLPHLPFLHLAVAEKGERAPVLAFQAGRQRKADRAGQALAERSAHEIDERGSLRADCLKLGAVLAVEGKLARINSPGLGRSRIKPDHVVPRRDHKAIAAKTHDAVTEQNSENFGGGQSLAQIAEALDGNHAGRVEANLRRQTTQARHIGGRPRQHLHLDQFRLPGSCSPH